MVRFANTIGFKPPSLYNRKLRGRLRRYPGRTVVIWGTEDHLVPRAHAEAYHTSLPNAARDLLEGARHSVVAEQSEQVAQRLIQFLKGVAP